MEIIDIRNSKKALRKAIKDKQKNLTREYIKYADEQICRNILSMPEYKNAQAVFCFVGTKDEIDTTMILNRVLADGKKLLVPKCREKGHMDVYEITGLDQLEPGAYGILEPAIGSRMAEPWEIQFGVIPCMSCDKEGHRLGHGGGYYDRYLEKAQAAAKAQIAATNVQAAAKAPFYRQLVDCFPRAVICREFLMLETVPYEATDQMMDFVVTENGIIRL